jgi:dTDP-glucose pyrophosphorylase
MKILIPMAGAGTRFEKIGYTFPKPLIEICGKPIIRYALESFRGFPKDTEMICVFLKEHEEKFHISQVVKRVAEEILPFNDIQFVFRDKVSNGAAQTVLDALDFINVDIEDEFIISNCDQKIIWDSKLFLQMRHGNHVILTFNSIHPRWSYAMIENGLVTEVAEKNPISNIATVGVYYYQKIVDFIWGAHEMIRKNRLVNNESYVCPVYNELIGRGDKTKIFEVDKMFGLGTPEEVKYFEDSYKIS